MVWESLTKQNWTNEYNYGTAQMLCNACSRVACDHKIVAIT